MSRSKHGPRPIVQVLDAVLLTLNALLIVSVMVFVVLTVMTYVSGGSVSGSSLLAVMLFILGGCILAAADYGVRKALERIDPRPTGSQKAIIRADRMNSPRRQLKHTEPVSHTQHPVESDQFVPVEIDNEGFGDDGLADDMLDE
jgi:hypothetical protein